MHVTNLQANSSIPRNLFFSYSYGLFLSVFQKWFILKCQSKVMYYNNAPEKQYETQV